MQIYFSLSGGRSSKSVTSYCFKRWLPSPPVLNTQLCGLSVAGHALTMHEAATAAQRLAECRGFQVSVVDSYGARGESRILKTVIEKTGILFGLCNRFGFT